MEPTIESLAVRQVCARFVHRTMDGKTRASERVRKKEKEDDEIKFQFMEEIKIYTAFVR